MLPQEKTIEIIINELNLNNAYQDKVRNKTKKEIQKSKIATTKNLIL